MSILSIVIMTDSVWKWIRRLGGPGLILLGIADNAPFGVPAGSVDICVILLSAHHGWWPYYYAFMASVGEVLGGYLTYRLAEKGGKETLEKKVGKPRAEKLYKQFEKRGFMTVFTGAILPPPFPFTSVLMAAGVMQYPRKRFFSALTAGRALRFLTEVFLGRIYGQQMIDFFSRHYRPTMYALIALAVTAGIGALFYFKWYLPKAQREKGAGQGLRRGERKAPGKDQPTRIQDTGSAEENTTGAVKAGRTQNTDRR
jgi:membrane protein YqaA with SNARE-associated domain